MKVYLNFLMLMMASFGMNLETPQNDHSNDVIPLLEDSRLGIFHKNPLTRMLKEDQNISPTQKEEIQVVLVGKIAKAQKIVLGFLDKEPSMSQIRAIFIVKDENSKKLIESLVHREQNKDAMMAVLIVKDAFAREIIGELIGKDDTEEEVKALLFVKDDTGKLFVETLINREKGHEEIEILLFGKEENAKKVILKFLHRHNQATKMKMAMIDAQSNVKDIMEKMLQTDEREEEFKIVLIGKEESAKMALGHLLDQKDKTEGINMKVIGKNEHAKDIMQQVLTKITTNDGIRVVLLDEEGREQILSLGFVPKTAVYQNKINQGLLAQGTQGQIINKGLYGEYEDPNKCDYVQLKTDTDRVLEQMEEFYEGLKFFILTTKFDYLGFETAGSRLSAELAMITAIVKKMAPCNKPILFELAFILRTFNIMADSIEILKYYSTSPHPIYRLNFSIVDLNIRLYQLRTFRGDPNPFAEGYNRKLLLYSSLLNFLVEQFRSFKQVNFGEEMSFNKYYNRAESSLLGLTRSAIVNRHNKPVVSNLGTVMA